MATAPQPNRIIHVALDAQSISTRSAELEMERHKAISDLLYENSFQLAAPANAEGPYRLALQIKDDRLLIGIGCTATGHHEEVSIPLSPLKRLLHDYTIVCDNFYKTARAGDIHRLEAIDMGRRSIHDEGAETLLEILENKVILDKLTARRLFSLLYVLHMRNAPTL